MLTPGLRHITLHPEPKHQLPPRPHLDSDLPCKEAGPIKTLSYKHSFNPHSYNPSSKMPDKIAVKRRFRMVCTFAFLN